MDKALTLGTRVEKVVVFRRTDTDVPMQAGRDGRLGMISSRAQSEEAETERLPAEALSLIIYTSGTTGKPKGSVHTHAGCMLNVAKEIRYCMDLRDSDTLFWVTDIGWMMGPWKMIGVQFGAAPISSTRARPTGPNPTGSGRC